MYDAFSEDYDRFVNWESRLNFELPWLLQQLDSAPGRRVLDAACGTGIHAIALAQRGFQAAGADLSAPMIDHARENASQAGVSVQFVAAGFGQLAAAFPAPFDALLCLGNSLPHVLSEDELLAALRDFAACLRPGGLLILQNRNFDMVMAGLERWMEPQGHHEGDREWIFVRFYDYLPDGLIQFNILTLHRANPSAGWAQRITTTRLRPLLQVPLTQALQAAGFGHITAFGSMEGSSFQPGSSGNLIIVAHKAG